MRLAEGLASGLLLLFLLPTAEVQAQDFKYTTNSGAITITGYTGPGGTVTIPAMINTLPVTSIGDHAFLSIASLTNVTIPDSVTNIGFAAFSSCFHLTSVTIGNSVATIGGRAFDSCGLTQVSIPNSVTDIGIWGFHLAQLTSATLGSNVANIEPYAFQDCGLLTSITIPSSVTNIGDAAFSGCTSLRNVYFKGNAPTLGGAVFEFYTESGDAVFDPATVYYWPGTTGWGPTVAGLPAALWPPQVLTTDVTFGVKTNQFGFSVKWASGMVVEIEACSNLVNPVWQSLETNTLTGGAYYFTDPQWMNYPSRFYRIRSP